MKPTPVSPMQAATCAGVSRIFAPSASSTSALPDFDDTERLPCLATRAPAPAATNIAAVEMLNVCEASPPVPTTHELASVALSGDLEARRQARALDRQRMIARDRERRSQPGEDPLLAVRDGGEFAVHYAPGAHDPTAEGLPDRLMAEAHAED